LIGQPAALLKKMRLCAEQLWPGRFVRSLTL
jgi:hypothetical protein